MSEHPVVVGRDRELELVERFVHGDRQGPRALLIEGVAGIGKTTVWEEAVRRASQGAEVITARPAEAEAAITFASLHDLLSPLVPEGLPLLPQPRRIALTRALMLDEGTEDGSPHDLALPLAVTDLLQNASADGQLVLAVDDAQWVDSSTASVVAFAMRRLTTSSALVILSRRSEHDGGLDASFTEDVERIELEALSVGATYHLIRDHLGVALPRPQLLRVHEASGGIPFYAIEVARDLDALIDKARPGAPLPVPLRLKSVVERRIDDLSDETRVALAALAATPSRSIEAVVKAVGDSARADLRTACDAGVITMIDGRAEFSHPLWASHAYDAVDSTSRRDIHHRLATCTSDMEERARHLYLSTDPPDESVAEELERAGRLAAARGAAEAAAELTDMSIEMTRDSDNLHRRRLLAADHHFAAGHLDRSRSLLDSMSAELEAGPLRCDVMQRLGVLVSRTENPFAAMPFFQQAADEAQDDLRRRLDAEIWLAFTKIPAGDFNGAIANAERAVAVAGSLDDPVAHGVALLQLESASFLLGGGYRSDGWAKARELVGDAAARLPVEWNPEGWEAMTLKWSDRLDEARSIMEPKLRATEERGDESGLPIELYHASELETWAGRWDVAEEHAQRALQIAEQTGQDTVRCFALYSVALVSAHKGEVQRARAAAEEGMNIAQLASSGPGMILNASILGFVALSLDEYAEADQRLAPLVQIAEAGGTGEPGVFRFVPDGIEAAIAVGDRERAVAVLEHFETLAENVGRVWALGTAARCRSLLAASDGDLPSAQRHVEKALERLRLLPMPFEVGRTLLVKGQIERRARQKIAARSSLEDAASIFKELGAELWALKADTERDRTGIRAESSLDLTPTEKRVAELVAAGKTNREAAEILFVSAKAVEANLSRIYRKLGIRSRSELVRKLTS